MYSARTRTEWLREASESLYRGVMPHLHIFGLVDTKLSSWHLSSGLHDIGKHTIKGALLFWDRARSTSLIFMSELVYKPGTLLEDWIQIFGLEQKSKHVWTWKRRKGAWKRRCQETQEGAA
jgi:hypothetical protein